VDPGGPRPGGLTPRVPPSGRRLLPPAGTCDIGAGVPGTAPAPVSHRVAASTGRPTIAAVTEDQPLPRPFRDEALGSFAERLASAEPVPGGGSASAVAASLAASLVSMVARLSQDRPKYADHAGLHIEATAAGLRLARRCLDLADEDARAYGVFAAALKMPRQTDEEIGARRGAMQAAARRAAEVPLACVEACLEIAGYAEALAGRSNVNAGSDVVVAALLAEAAARGAGQNVLVNLPATGDGSFEGVMTARLDGLLDETERLASRAREVVGSGQSRDPLPGPGGG